LHQILGSEASESLPGRSEDADMKRREDGGDKQSTRIALGRRAEDKSRVAARGQFVSDRHSPQRKARQDEEAGKVFFDASECHLFSRA
jgi:hypothetical protein